MYSTILAAVDVNNPTTSEACAAKAKALADLTGAELHVVTVMPDDGMSIVSNAFGPDHDELVRKAGKDALAAFTEAHLTGARQHIARGSIYDNILRTANAVGADLIVIGAHRPELRDYLVGPNAAKVARHANQSVLIVR